jgi:hypothetical protein
MKYLKTYEERNKGYEVVYTFKAKAISGKYEYAVHILYNDDRKDFVRKDGTNYDETNGHSYDNLSISIATTPGMWYVATFLHYNPNDHSDKIHIDGDNWICTNRWEIENELKDWIKNEYPFWRASQKYNL